MSNTSSCTLNYNPWGLPTIIATRVFEDRIEIDYRADSNISVGFFPTPPKVWKEIFRAVDGKLVKEIKEGQYHSPQEEYYTFD